MYKDIDRNTTALARTVQYKGGDKNPPYTSFTADVLPEAKRPIQALAHRQGCPPEMYIKEEKKYDEGAVTYLLCNNKFQLTQYSVFTSSRAWNKIVCW